MVGNNDCLSNRKAKQKRGFKAMAKKKSLYPGTEEAEKEKCKPWRWIDDSKPDLIGTSPNYSKFQNWKCEEVLVWLNID